MTDQPAVTSEPTTSEITADSTEMNDKLAKALHAYDKAIRAGSSTGIAKAAAKLRKIQNDMRPPASEILEPALENTQANSAADLYESMSPIEQAVVDGKPRVFYLNGGMAISGIVIDAMPTRFIVRSGFRTWIVVRESVQAIRLPDSVE